MISEQDMKALQREDEAMSREVSSHGRRNGRQAVVDQRVFMQAVATEGHGILGPEGRGYWNDMKRRYPHLRGNRGVDGDNASGSRNRFGRVKERRREGGRWERWNGKDWEAVEA